MYTVNALMRALSVTDYQRVTNELARVSEQLNMLTQAVEDYGLVIECDENGNLILTKGE